MKTKILTFLITGILFGSCCVDRLHSSNSQEYYVPVKARKVEVYSTDKTNRPYTIVGDAFTSVVVVGKGSSSVKYLKKEAAALGADAVINVEYTTNSTCGGVGASGVAVKLNPNVVAAVQVQ